VLIRPDRYVLGAAGTPQELETMIAAIGATPRPVTKTAPELIQINAATGGFPDAEPGIPSPNHNSPGFT
jgi:hypothetical protein